MVFKNDAAEFVYTRTYSRWREADKRRETWEETVDRYVSFIKDQRGDKIPPKVLKKIRQYILSFDVMPSMRAMWAAGDAALQDNTTIYNCSFSKVNAIESFSECLYILMCGTGFGFSVRRVAVNELPEIPTINTEGSGTLVVEDSRAGWANSVKELVSSLYQGKDLSMDYSLLRPKGARLKSMGGRSSGPAPLIGLHEFIRQTFAKAQGRKLLDIECHDIQNKVAEIVVVGGVRRSSEISLSDLDSDSMMNAKTGAFPLHRYMANNSAIYDHKPSAVQFLKEWSSLAASGSGERGIFNLDSARKRSPKRRDSSKIEGVNPCVIGSTEILTKDGYKRIDSLVGIPVEIWNGFEWSLVTPAITGLNQDVLTVTFDNGRSLTCTKYHTFHILTPYTWNSEKVKALDLQPGMKLIKHELPVTEQLLKSENNNRDVTVVNVVQSGTADIVYCFNEPKRHLGIFNGVITGQCGEILLRDKQFCNLSEVILRQEDDVDTLIDKVETATWIGVIQSTFTYFPYLSKEWKENCEEERLLGVSITGQMDNRELLTPDVLKALKRKAIKVAKHASEKMDINMPSAITCVKPSGTVSQLVDSASGIHTRYSQYYIRRYRISSMDPLYRMLKDQGVPMNPEVGQIPENATTWVLEFPVKAPTDCITRNDLTAIEQLEHNWCEHNASATIYVKDQEWFEVGNWVYKNWDSINGVSFLPHDGGIYELAPYEEINKDKYNKLVKEFPKIDYSQLSRYELEDQTEGSQNLACVSGVCEI
jgi:hypothetical protein